MSTSVFIFTACAMFGTIITCAWFGYLALSSQARAKIAKSDAYQDLAQKAVSHQGQIALSLSTVQSELAQIGARLASVEKVLKDVG